MNDNNTTQTLEDEVRAVHQKYAHFIVRGQEPQPGELDPINVKEFWKLYSDYAVSSVSTALRKAELAMEYIAAMQKHPAYNYETYVQHGDPVGTACDYISKQIVWANEQLRSHLFFALRSDEEQEKEVVAEAMRLQNLRDAFAPVVDQNLLDAVRLYDVDNGPSKITSIVKDPEAGIAIDEIVTEFYDLGRDQIENRVTIVEKIIDLIAEKTVVQSPFLNRHINLSKEFVQNSLLDINTQFKAIEWSNAKRNVTEAGVATLPLLKAQPLDFSL